MLPSHYQENYCKYEKSVPSFAVMVHEPKNKISMYYSAGNNSQISDFRKAYPAAKPIMQIYNNDSMAEVASKISLATSFPVEELYLHTDKEALMQRIYHRKKKIPLALEINILSSDLPQLEMLERFKNDTDFRDKTKIIDLSGNHVGTYDISEQVAGFHMIHCITLPAFQEVHGDLVKKNKYVQEVLFPALFSQISKKNLEDTLAIQKQWFADNTPTEPCFLLEIVLEANYQLTGNPTQLNLNNITLKANKLLSNTIPFCRYGSRVVVHSDSNIKSLPSFKNWTKPLKKDSREKLVFKIQSDSNDRYSTLIVYPNRIVNIKMNWDETNAVNSYKAVTENLKLVEKLIGKINSHTTEQIGFDSKHEVILMNVYCNLPGVIDTLKFQDFLKGYSSFLLPIPMSPDSDTLKLRFTKVNGFNVVRSIHKLNQRFSDQLNRKSFIKDIFSNLDQATFDNYYARKKIDDLDHTNGGIELNIQKNTKKMFILGVNFDNLSYINSFMTFLTNIFGSNASTSTSAQPKIITEENIMDMSAFIDDDDDDDDVIVIEKAVAESNNSDIKISQVKYQSKKNRFLSILEAIDPEAYSGDYSRKCQNQRTPMVIIPEHYEKIKKLVNDKVTALEKEVEQKPSAEASRALKEFLIHKLVLNEGATKYKGMYYFCPLVWNFNVNLDSDDLKIETVFPLYEEAKKLNMKNEIHFIEDKNLKRSLDKVKTNNDITAEGVHTWYASFLLTLKKKKLIGDDDHKGPTCSACCFFGEKKRAREGREACVNKSDSAELPVTGISNYIVSANKELAPEQYGFIEDPLNRILNYSKTMPDQPRVAAPVEYYLRVGTKGDFLEAIAQALKLKNIKRTLSENIKKLNESSLQETDLYNHLVNSK